MSNLLNCLKCPKMKFKNQDSLSRHVYEYHCDECTITVSFQDQSKKINIKRNKNGLPCPNCKKFYITRQNLKTHFNKSACQESFFKSVCDDIPQENDEPRICFIKRDYDASIVDACGGSELEKSQQEQLLKIVDAINLKPVCLLSSNGEEQFMLVHEKHFGRISKSDFISILPVCENENNTISEV